MLELYREYAREQFPALVEIVDARKVADPTMGFGGEGGGRGAYDGGIPPAGYGQDVQYGPDGQPLPTEDYLVDWLDQGAVQLKLDFKTRPSSKRIWVTQEDLWVYETLLHAIADTNDIEGATRPDNAAIATIVMLQVGQEAAFASSEPGVILGPPSAASVATGMEGGLDPRMGGIDGGMPMSTDGMAADPDMGLLMSRYIGDDGKPIADETTAISPTAQFRRLPVRMVLMMEQQAIPTIVIECANATLPIEVTRIRVNKEKSGAGMESPFSAAAGGGMDGGRGGEGYGGRGGYDGGRGGGYGGIDGGYGGRGGEGGYMPTAPLGGVARTDLANVEIQGIVYIYNPPDATTMTVPGGPAGDPAAVAGADVAVDATVAR
jgi:hypothetical protein